MRLTRITKILLVVLAILGWFALIAQLYININSKAAPLSEIITRYFSYFTILTNLLVVICCTSLLFNKDSVKPFFSRQKTLAAITVYIVIVGIIYNVILRFLWEPQGLQKVVDELLHSVIPGLFLIYWLIFILKDQLQWKDVWPWLIYPLVYITFILIRGSVSGYYPYPFIDMDKLGVQKTLINAFGIAMLFLVVSLIFVGIGKLIKRRSAG